MSLVLRVSKRIALRRLRLGLTLAGWFGAWSGTGLIDAQPLTRNTLERLTRGLSRRRIRRIARQMVSAEYRDRTLVYTIRRRGLDPALPLLRIDSGPLDELLAQQSPVVLVAWHLGPRRALVAALHALGRPALVAGSRATPDSIDSTSVETWNLLGGGLRAGFLRRAVDTLKAGGIVSLALDGTRGARQPVRFLGQDISVGRGAATLARLTGARFVPVTTRWIGNSARIEVCFHPPIPTPVIDRSDAARFEAALLESATLWFESYLRSHPETLRIEPLPSAPPAVETPS